MKKRIITIALVCALLATCFGGTLAYLKDAAAVKNTFTTGNVYITLTEDGAVNGENDYHLIPNNSYTKNPTITLNAGSEDAYVAAKITVTGTSDLSTLLPMYGAPGFIDINAVVDGGLMDQTGSHGEYKGLAVFQNDNYAVHQVANGNNTWTLYIFMKVAQKAETKTVLFTTLNTLPEWDNDQMDMIRGMKIDVQAFATQAHGFADCYDAMTKAFVNDFPLAQNP